MKILKHLEAITNEFAEEHLNEYVGDYDDPAVFDVQMRTGIEQVEEGVEELLEHKETAADEEEPEK